jgi:hypothetical protein
MAESPSADMDPPASAAPDGRPELAEGAASQC